MTKRREMAAAVAGSRAIDLTGQRRGAWTIICRVPGSRTAAMRWLCRCDCGVERAVVAQSLLHGKSTARVECGRRAAHIAARRPLEERFWRYIEPEPNSGCWLWVGSTDRRGYGQLREVTGLRYATQIAIELYKGGNPLGLNACHKCDIPSCVNPDHLFLGTQKDNMQDAKRKGRLDLSGLALGWGHNRKEQINAPA